MRDFNALDPPLAARMEQTTITDRPRVSLLADDTGAKVAEEVQASSAPCVYVEGFSGAGKSHFAGKLAHLLGWQHIEFDGQVSGNAVDLESWAEFMDEGKVLRFIATPAQRARKVLDSICLREILQRFNTIDPNAFIVYVAKVTEHPGEYMWHDGLHIEDGPDEAPSWMNRATIRYHLAFHPYAAARHILLRVEK